MAETTYPAPGYFAVSHSEFGTPMGQPIKDGKITPGRWRFINELLDHGEDRDKLIADFHKMFGIKPELLSAELAAYRHDGPPRMQ